MDLLNSPDAALGSLAACAAKATVLLTVAWIVTMALRDQSAAMRHRVWAAGILSAMSLPLLTMVLPAWPWAAWEARAQRGARTPRGRWRALKTCPR